MLHDTSFLPPKSLQYGNKHKDQNIRDIDEGKLRYTNNFFETSYDHFMKTLVPCIDEAVETAQIEKIIQNLNSGCKLECSEDGGDTWAGSSRIQLIQSAWYGTEFVARTIDNRGKVSKLIRPDFQVACYNIKSTSLRTENDIGPLSFGDEIDTSGSPYSTLRLIEDERIQVNPVYPTDALLDYTAYTASDSGSSQEEEEEYDDRQHEELYEGIAAIMDRQHRTHFFSVEITGHTVRFLRWDRAGAIVTNPLCFDKDLTDLITFLYRFARMTAEQQGEDSSVLKPELDEIKALDEFRSSTVPGLVPQHQDYFEHAFVKNLQQFSIVKIQLDKLPPSPATVSSDDHCPHPTLQKLRLLIGAPNGTNPHPPFGRATKGFLAYDLDEKRLKFVKDSWRYDGNTHHPELETYQRIQTRLKQPLGTRSGLAIAEGGGDVVDSFGNVQQTLTDAFLNTGTIKTLSQLHYRVVIRQVGTPLEKYQPSSGYLCKHVREAMKGHFYAWEEAHVLHQDVNPENILIDEDPEGGSRENPKGFLYSWGLCKYRDELNSGPKKQERSGTWPFVSAALLYYPSKHHELADDLESFIHVINWFCLRFHHPELFPEDIIEGLSIVYFSIRNVNGYDLGSMKKLYLMQEGKGYFELQNVNEGLSRLVTRLSKLCMKHYATLDSGMLETERNELLNIKPRPFPPPLQHKVDPSLLGFRPNPKKTEQASLSTNHSKPQSPSSSDLADQRSKTSKPSPSPFINHSKFLKILKKYLGNPSYWKWQDKTREQFSYVASQRIYLITPHKNANTPAPTNVSTGSKRSSSVAFGDSGTESKRPRTDDLGNSTETESFYYYSWS
ncbi:hypothetical protein ABKN59_003941 [Abortiporus biennis]